MSSPSVRAGHPVTLLLRGVMIALLFVVASGATSTGGEGPGEGGRLLLHTELEAATPGDGAVVEGTLEQVLLRFTTPVQLPLSRVVVADGEGRPVAGSLDLVDASGGTELRFAPGAPLDRGRYRVEWQTAGPDSHIIRGELMFRVTGVEAGVEGVEGVAGGPGVGLLEQAADTVNAAPLEDSLELAEESGSSGSSGSTGHAIRWLQYVGMILVMGAVAFRLFVVPFVLRQSALAQAGAAMMARLSALSWVGVGFLALSLPARLWSQSLGLWGGESLEAANLVTLVFRTSWGWGWLLQIAAILLVAVGLRMAAPAGSLKRGWGVVAVAALLLAFIPAFSGHAWGIEPRVVGVLLSGAHVLAAGAWMGGLAALLLAGLPGIRTVPAVEGHRPGLVTVVDAFSRMALAAVLVLVAAGVGQNIFHLGSPGNLVSTGWGRTMLVKLGLLAGAGALGLYNWRVVRPALRETPRAGLLRIPATVEFLLGLAILAATAVLVSRPLP